MSKNVSIVGGGLVGSLEALYMLKRGHSVNVFEKRVDPRTAGADSGRSINLIITSRGIKALELLDIKDQVLSESVPVFGRMIHDIEGKTTYQPYGKDNSECNYSISRGQLNIILIDLAEKAGAKFFFDHDLTNLDVDKNEIQFGDRKFTSDIIFGADGSGSVVRKELERQNLVESTIEWLDADYKELYMPATNDGNYQIEKNALHIWPRGDHFLMALPNLKGSFTVTLYIPPSSEHHFDHLRTKELAKSYFEKFYPSAIPLMKDYLEQFTENPVGKLGTVRSFPWNYKGQVALIGDAAHAIVPFFGQGMNAGFEDCTVLEEILDDSETLEQAFSKYTEFQKPNGDAIATMAIENYREMSEHVGDEKFLFKKKIEKELVNRFPDRFNSRYRMVVYGLRPYKEAYDQGIKNKETIEKLAAGVNNLEDVDWGLAEKML
ncbi:MAG: FAD-dependent monooxygenase [Bacteriovoracaceae bacterium]|jgi:kynurenine 3-monooxygenase|nr:FAD-dependent monooxygenase [Bacteriovoracaceae bacterium]